MAKAVKTATKAATKTATKTVAPKTAAKAARVTVSTTITPRKPTPKFETLSSWSYSVYTQYMKCALSVCFQKIQKIKIIGPPNPAFIKGDMVHKNAELQITAPKAPKLIPELKGVKDKLAFFRKLAAKVELEWAFTKDYQLTSWFGRDAYLRIKTDVCAESYDGTQPLVHITDWKTGKVYDDHKQQRSLYALGGLQLVENGLLVSGDKAVKVIAEHAYTDTGFTATEEFRMKDLNPLKREWAARIKTMMSDTRYPAKPGFHCRWCDFRKSAGGPCQENQ